MTTAWYKKNPYRYLPFPYEIERFKNIFAQSVVLKVPNVIVKLEDAT